MIHIPTYKKSDLKRLSNIFRAGQGTREEYLAYAFLRGVPYRTIEPRTFWDTQDKLMSYQDATIVSWSYCWKITAICADILKCDFVQDISYHDLNHIIKDWFKGGTNRMLRNVEEYNEYWRAKHDNLREKSFFKTILDFFLCRK